MKFKELKKFVAIKMKMEKDHNYQPVMIKTLMQNNGSASKAKIKLELQRNNPQYPTKYFSNSSVFQVLTENHHVAEFDERIQKYVLIDYDSFSITERTDLIQLCEQKITDTLKNTQKNSKIISQNLKNESSLHAQKRTCMGTCKKFQVAKPRGIGRYGSGQCHCQMCNVWMDHNGCKLKDGSDATAEDYGWFCKCCNYRVRRRPRNAKYKAKFRALTKQDTEYNNTDTKIDSSYFNKQQIKMIQKIAQTIPENQKDFDLAVCVEQLWNNNISKYDIVTEFDEEIEKIIELAYTIAPPNQISMIVEFERIKYLLDHIPTKQDIDKYSELNSSQYNDKFQSWEYLLDKLDYYSQYKNESKVNVNKFNKSKANVNKSSESKTDGLDHKFDKNYFSDRTVTEVNNKVNEIREQIQIFCKKRDAETGYMEYSHEEMFYLLEQYLMMLPNKEEYKDIKNFL